MDNNTYQNNNKKSEQTIKVTKLGYTPSISIMDTNVRDIVECINNTLKPIIQGYIGAVADVSEQKGITFKILINGKSPLLISNFLTNLPIKVNGATQLSNELKTKLSIYCDDKIEFNMFKGNGGKSNCIITLNAIKVMDNTFPKPENGFAYKLKILNPSNRKRNYFGRIRLIKARINILKEAEEIIKDCDED